MIPLLKIWLNEKESTKGGSEEGTSRGNGLKVGKKQGRGRVKMTKRFETQPCHLFHTEAPLRLVISTHEWCRVHICTRGGSSRHYVCHTKTLANASAPALAIYGFWGWKATSCIDSSNFLRCDVISWTHVLLSRFHNLIEQSWPAKEGKLNMY